MAVNFFDSTFRTLPLEISKYGFSTERLQQLYDELVAPQKPDEAITVLTLALTLPNDTIERCPHEVTKAFEKSLRDELRWSNKSRINNNAAYFKKKVRFVWAYKVTGEPCSRLRVWQVAVLLDPEMLSGMNQATEQFRGLMQMAWCRALGFTKFNPKLLVKYGRKPKVLIPKRRSSGFTQTVQTFQRLSVLAELPKNSSCRDVVGQSSLA